MSQALDAYAMSPFRALVRARFSEAADEFAQAIAIGCDLTPYRQHLDQLIRELQQEWTERIAQARTE